MSGPKQKPLIEKIYSNLIKTESCWHWKGAVTTQGYGRISMGRNKGDLAHRVMLNLMGLEIPKHLVVDHICMNKLCVNPDHLRIVSRSVNATENSDSMGAINKRKTHCKRGHPFTEKNTRTIFKDGNKWRACRKCHALLTKYYRQKNLNHSDGNNDKMQ